MGQYFRAVLVRADSPEVVVVSPRTFDSFSKLTESAWVSNDYVRAVLQRLAVFPARVAWLGDYSRDDVSDREEVNLGNGFITSKTAFEPYYKTVWPAPKAKKLPLQRVNAESTDAIFPAEAIYDEATKKSTLTEDYYIVNVTKKCFIHMAEYLAENEDDGWCVAPLPILAAVGNGYGGGDYEGSDMEYVGTWAFDEIFVCKKEPTTYLLCRDCVPFLPHFKEG